MMMIIVTMMITALNSAVLDLHRAANCHKRTLSNHDGE